VTSIEVFLRVLKQYNLIQIVDLCIQRLQHMSYFLCLTSIFKTVSCTINKFICHYFLASDYPRKLYALVVCFFCLYDKWLFINGLYSSRETGRILCLFLFLSLSIQTVILRIYSKCCDVYIFNDFKEMVYTSPELNKIDCFRLYQYCNLRTKTIPEFYPLKQHASRFILIVMKILKMYLKVK
jgi:hypothetical protein